MSTATTTWTPQSGERRTTSAGSPATDSTTQQRDGASAPATAGRHPQSTWNATVRTMLGAALAVTLVLLAFSWPTYTARTKDMPLAVVGSDAQRAQVAQQVGSTFELRQYPSEQAAQDAIRRREVYGALVLPQQGSAATHVLTSSAASTAASQVITVAAQRMGAAQLQAAMTAKQQAATQLAQLGAQAAAAQASARTLTAVAAQLPPSQAAAMAPRIAEADQQAAALAAQLTAAQAKLAAAPTPSVTVTDVVPLAASDARGAGLGVASLPLAMGGMIGGVLISLLVVGWRRRLAAVAGYGVFGGLAMAFVLHTWFAFVPGSFWMLALVCGTAVAATATFIVGAQSVLGQPGIALGAVATLFVGNPLSGQAMPAEWLPWHWGSIGQGFVPGAAGNLMRLEAYFPDAATGRFWLTLVLWIVAGLVLTLLGHHRDDEVVHIEGSTESSAPRHALVEQ